MLPPGHIAGSYLTAKAVLGSLHYNLTQNQARELLWLGASMGLIPDFDFFAAFVKIKSFRIDNDQVSHRSYFTHAPLIWLVLGLAIFFFAQSEFFKAAGLIIWLGSWSHFILDSEWGIMWLWPFSKKLYPFSEQFYQKKYQEKPQPSNSFWKYWFYLAKDYYLRPLGIIEIILILMALFIK